LMQEIQRAVATSDAGALGRAAHTLKGMISNFCAPDAHAAALAVEKIGKSGDLSTAAAAVKTLEDRLQALIEALECFLAARNS
jgi:two-component system, sensor histidine kinase and response regulator